MIAGSLEGLDPAACPWPAVQRVLRSAADPAILDAPLGRHALEGDRLYLNLSEYDTRAPEAGLPETHREFCDVQVVLRGEERIGWAPLSPLWTPSGPYQAARDLQTYLTKGGLSWLVAAPGRFFVFLASDVHHPGVALGSPGRVRKLVGKVHRSLMGAP